jgi:RimJ/RimL family protein N-acetyltransferase
MRAVACFGVAGDAAALEPSGSSKQLHPVWVNRTVHAHRRRGERKSARNLSTRQTFSDGCTMRAMAELSYPVNTDRLRLRPFDASRDVDAMHAYRGLPEACRYVPFEPSTRQQIAERLSNPRFVRSQLEHEGDALSLAVDLSATGQMIGDVVLFWHCQEDRSGEIGYILHPDHQGHGYATEACLALLGLAFDDLGLHRVTAEIDVRNPQSASVARRLGMREEGVRRAATLIKGEWVSHAVFAILEDEWRQLHSTSTQAPRLVEDRA